jgi:hypothetical protein
MKKLSAYFTTETAALTCVVTDLVFGGIDWTDTIVIFEDVDGRLYGIWSDKLRYVEAEDYQEE